MNKVVVTHRLQDANPAQHFAYETDNCEACTQASGWFPGKYADLPMWERNRKAIRDEIEWMEKNPRFGKG